MKGFIFEGINMEKHQEEYIKLLDEKFGLVGKPRRAYYDYYSTLDRGIRRAKKLLP